MKQTKSSHQCSVEPDSASCVAEGCPIKTRGVGLRNAGISQQLRHTTGKICRALVKAVNFHISVEVFIRILRVGFCIRAKS